MSDVKHYTYIPSDRSESQAAGLLYLRLASCGLGLLTAYNGLRRLATAYRYKPKNFPQKIRQSH